MEAYDKHSQCNRDLMERRERIVALEKELKSWERWNEGYDDEEQEDEEEESGHAGEISLAEQNAAFNILSNRAPVQETLPTPSSASWLRPGIGPAAATAKAATEPLFPSIKDKPAAIKLEVVTGSGAAASSSGAPGVVTETAGAVTTRVNEQNRVNVPD